MKLSQMTDTQIENLSAAQKLDIVYGDDATFSVPPHTDAVILLGGPPDVMPERARSAATLYTSRKTQLIVASGGVTPPGETRCEAEILRELLVSCGVADEHIRLETAATSTHENMICSYLLLMRCLGLFGVNHIAIVTSRYHLRRSMALANNYLPRHCRLYGYADDPAPREMPSETLAFRLGCEIKFDRELILNGMMADIDV